MFTVMIGLPERATPNRKMEASVSVQQRDKMADGPPRRLCVSHFPLQCGRFFREKNGSLRTDLEVDFERTQNYCVELLALYLRRIIISMQYSIMLLACAGAAETMPFHGPQRKSFNLLQFSPTSLPRCGKSLLARKEHMLFVNRPIK